MKIKKWTCFLCLFHFCVFCSSFIFEYFFLAFRSHMLKMPTKKQLLIFPFIHMFVLVWCVCLNCAICALRKFIWNHVTCITALVLATSYTYKCVCRYIILFTVYCIVNANIFTHHIANEQFCPCDYKSKIILYTIWRIE